MTLHILNRLFVEDASRLGEKEDDQDQVGDDVLVIGGDIAGSQRFGDAEDHAAEHGAVVKNGLEMLLLQAFESWEIWTARK